MSNQEYPPFGKPEGSTSLAIKIGLAIFLAILAASAIRWLYANWVMQQAVESLSINYEKYEQGYRPTKAVTYTFIGVYSTIRLEV